MSAFETITVPDRRKITERRMREQQLCRDYWQRMYGIEAERLSRGGVMWLR